MKRSMRNWHQRQQRQQHQQRLSAEMRSWPLPTLSADRWQPMHQKSFSCPSPQQQHREEQGKMATRGEGVVP